MTRYFFDTYALIALIDRNENYEPYADSEIITTNLNVYEVLYAMIRRKRLEKGEELVEDLTESLVQFDLRILKEAALMRFAYRKTKMSMVDCIGYCLARHLGIPFLTGDKEFEDLENVEYVK